MGNSRRIAVLDDDEDENASDHELVNDSVEPGWDDHAGQYHEEDLYEEHGRGEVDLFADAQDEDHDEDREEDEDEEDEDEARDDTEELEDVRTPPRATARLPVDRVAESVQRRAEEEHGTRRLSYCNAAGSLIFLLCRLATRSVIVKKEIVTELKQENITFYSATQGQGKLHSCRISRHIH